MAATDATMFPVKNQNFRCPVTFRDVTGNLVSNWTGAVATAYPDNAGGFGMTIAESPAGSGLGYIDVASSSMNSSMTMIKATITNANATAFIAAIYPANLGQFSGRYDAQATLRMEQMFQEMFILLGGNGVDQTGSAMVYRNPDASPHVSSQVIQSQLTATKTKPI